MALQTLSVLPPLDLPPLAPPDLSEEVAAFAASARMEFQAALQLLAERAAFVTAATGVAIVLNEGGTLVYQVATGNEVAEPEASVEVNNQNIQRCLRDGVPVRVAGIEFGFRLFTPVKRNGRAVGFMEVVSAYELSDGDVNAVARLADLACVALDHLDAAESTDGRFWEKLQAPVAPNLWHAPDEPASEESALAEAEPPAADPQVHLCHGCGFPISPGRKLCVECEQKPHVAIAASTEIFALQPRPGWFAEHGYTVASLILSVLAVAVIFWLRR